MSVRRITPGRPRTKPADDGTGRVGAWLGDAVRAYVEHAELHDVLYGHTPINATTEMTHPVTGGLLLAFSPRRGITPG
ncbi:hypothetical protein ACFVV7_11930 [Streptomyces globisporus]|uniref:hypothetical protein n=1 Tax=Streptomyces globisporus TaxID=1908 RepID=UPI0036DA039E